MEGGYEEHSSDETDNEETRKLPEDNRYRSRQMKVRKMLKRKIRRRNFETKDGESVVEVRVKNPIPATLSTSDEHNYLKAVKFSAGIGGQIQDLPYYPPNQAYLDENQNSEDKIEVPEERWGTTDPSKITPNLTPGPIEVPEERWVTTDHSKITSNFTPGHGEEIKTGVTMESTCTLVTTKTTTYSLQSLEKLDSEPMKETALKNIASVQAVLSEILDSSKSFCSSLVTADKIELSNHIMGPAMDFGSTVMNIGLEAVSSFIRRESDILLNGDTLKYNGYELSVKGPDLLLVGFYTNLKHLENLPSTVEKIFTEGLESLRVKAKICGTKMPEQGRLLVGLRIQLTEKMLRDVESGNVQNMLQSKVQTNDSLWILELTENTVQITLPDGALSDEVRLHGPHNGLIAIEIP